MSKETQIKKMAHCICNYNRGVICALDGKICDLKCISGRVAKELYDKGYRQRSETVKEIADFVYDGEIKGLAISMGGEFITKDEFVDKFSREKTEVGE